MPNIFDILPLELLYIICDYVKRDEDEERIILNNKNLYSRLVYGYKDLIYVTSCIDKKTGFLDNKRFFFVLQNREDNKEMKRQMKAHVINRNKRTTMAILKNTLRDTNYKNALKQLCRLREDRHKHQFF